jgi:glycerol-3-phosphate acyltransferase PlsY
VSQILISTLVVSLAYMLGALPVAYLVAKAAKGVDIRQVGSGNPGALNVYRQVGTAAALVVLLLDVGEGAVVVFLSRWLGTSEMATYMAALAVVVGHNWSLFLGLRGGKGVATVMGISLAVLPVLTVVVVPFAALALGATRNVVISMAATFTLLNVLTIATSQPVHQIALCLGLTVLVASTHFYRAGPQMMPALRERRWMDATRVE